MITKKQYKNRSVCGRQQPPARRTGPIDCIACEMMQSKPGLTVSNKTSEGEN